MRPLKQGLLSCVQHVFVRNDIFYYRADIPKDLIYHFPTVEIKQSLKTKDSKLAKLRANNLEYQIQKAFMMLRTGMLSDDVAHKVVQELVPKTKQKAPGPPKTIILSAITKKYIDAMQCGWTEKTKMEVGSVVKLLQDIIGDVDVANITRPMVLELRTTLKKLPANLYKKYPGKTIQQILSTKDVDPMSTKSVNKHVPMFSYEMFALVTVVRAHKE